MCGIALIVSGLRFDLSALQLDSTSSSLLQSEQFLFSVDDLMAALGRRGPDSVGNTKILISSEALNSDEEQQIQSSIVREDAGDAGEYCLKPNDMKNYGVNGRNGQTVCLDSSFSFHGVGSVAELNLIGATLQLRGIDPIIQPLMDRSKNIIVYNGEIFGGLDVARDSNDTETLLQFLGNCCPYNSNLHESKCYAGQNKQATIPDVLSTIKGPWSIIYWQDSTKTLWFGRDAFGRRSLLVHWPTVEDTRFLLSSVSPPFHIVQDSGCQAEDGINKLHFWEELPCGIYSVPIDASNPDCGLVGEVRKHKWTNDLLKELIEWERTCVEPNPKEICSLDSVSAGPIQAPVSVPAEIVLAALRKSMMRRTSLHTIFQQQGVTFDFRKGEHGPVAVLFSGGLDSMILAALSDDCLDLGYEIDLINVSFDGPSAPDRISAKAGVEELRKIAPRRSWKLVEIDADLQNLTFETKHVMSLINPANTYMDLNIGMALWLAAGGDGWVYEEIGNNDKVCRVKYMSKARILLVGSGADEQCAGYGRHRTKYRSGSWFRLHEEMKLDMQRIWKRNLGRDDRCIADNGKEARFPFLDEDVIRTLLDFPLWQVANLDKPSGVGDKKILREVAHLLGLHEAAVLPKRAIQFGSRIARESNRQNFGSNRAANQASAGSVKIHKAI